MGDEKSVDRTFADDEFEIFDHKENNNEDVGLGEENILDDNIHSVVAQDIENLKKDLSAAYNPLSQQTIMLTQQKGPVSFDELRHQNPQLAIDYIYDRKEKWKSAAIRLNNRVKQLLTMINAKNVAFQKKEKQINEENEKKSREIRYWKRKHKQEVDMKNWWRNCFAISAGITAIAIIAMVLVSSFKNQEYVPARIPVSGLVQQTPARVLASTLIYNGDVQGSGTVISKGEKYAAILTAAHNFNGKIGGEFWVYYADGTFTRATLIAYDKDRDLALARVDASTILGNSFVPLQMPASTSFTHIGYSNGQGPNMNSLSYNSTYKNEHQKFMWDISLSDGTIWSGASGGGVFLGDACIGVTSQRNAVYYTNRGQSRRMYAVCHQEVLNFLNEHKNNLEGCGDWTQEPESLYGNGNVDAPPPWTPNSNVPINLPNNNVSALRQDVEELKRAVFGTQMRPSEVQPTETIDSTPTEKPLEGQRLPSEVDGPPLAPKE